MFHECIRFVCTDNALTASADDIYLQLLETALQRDEISMVARETMQTREDHIADGRVFIQIVQQLVHYRSGLPPRSRCSHLDELPHDVSIHCMGTAVSEVPLRTDSNRLIAFLTWPRPCHRKKQYRLRLAVRI